MLKSAMVFSPLLSFSSSELSVQGQRVSELVILCSINKINTNWIRSTTVAEFDCAWHPCFMLSSLLLQFLSCCYLTLLPVLVIPVKCTLNWTKASIQTELPLQNGVQMMWNKYQRLPSDTHKNMQIPSKARHSPLEDSESDFSPFVSVKRSISCAEKNSLYS